MVLSGRVKESVCMHACVYVRGDKVGVMHLTTWSYAFLARGRYHLSHQKYQGKGCPVKLIQAHSAAVRSKAVLLLFKRLSLFIVALNLCGFGPCFLFCNM